MSVYGYGYAHYNDEAYLVSAAGQALGGEVVTAAGIFSWAGQSAVLMGGSTVGGAMGAATALGAPVGGVVGGRLAVEATAAARGESVPLLVAVTESTVHILNWEGEAAGAEIRSFDRTGLETELRKAAAALFVTLRDRETGDTYSLHGARGPLARQGKPDHKVLAALGVV